MASGITFPVLVNVECNVLHMWVQLLTVDVLYLGYPLFPGENEVEQLACIMEIFGLPPVKLLEEAQRRKIFFGE